MTPPERQANRWLASSEEVAKALVERAALSDGIVTRDLVALKLKEEGIFRRLLSVDLPETTTIEELETYEDEIIAVWRRGGELEELHRVLVRIWARAEK